MQPNSHYSISVSLRSRALVGWSVVGLLCAVPVGFWLSLHTQAAISNFSSTIFSLGQLAGIIGLVLYSVNLILITRLKFLENMFGGLNRVYIAHHIIGGLALLFLTLHPLLLALRFIKTSAYEAVLLLLPNGLAPLGDLFDTTAPSHASVLQQWAIFFGIIAFWGLVVLLAVTLFVKLPYRLWLFIHKFLGVAFFFAGLHVIFVGSDLARSPALKFYLIGLVSFGLLAYLYKTLAGNIFIRKFPYVVDQVKTVGTNVSEIHLTPQQSYLAHLPGQFVFIRFPKSKAVGSEWHPFSISSAPESDKLRINVKALGDYTSTLASLRPGDKAEVEGAYGRFSYTKFKNHNQIWIAGGIGVTPFLSMAESLPTSGYKIDLYYCVNNTSELIDWQKLTGLSKTNKCFGLYTFVKSKNKTHLSAKMISQTTPLEGKEIFVCGPPAMMSGLRTQLRQLGIPASKIHTEEFSLS